MRLLLSLALLATVTAACRPSPDDPAGAAKVFISLIRAGKCDRAWEHMTLASQVHFEQLREGFVKHSPYPTQEPTASQFACSPYTSYLPRTVTERSRSGDTVVVAVISRTGTLFPIIPFLSDPRKDTPATMRVVQEKGQWKVSLPDDEVTDARREALERDERARAAAQRGAR